jgi:deoxyribose-phosphate aldolase
LDNWNKQLARLIDHTMLRPEATEDDVRRACREACAYRFAAVVVPPCCVAVAVKETGGRGVPVCSVVSFPYGWDSSDEKLRQAEALLQAGVDEIDVVMNLSKFLSGRHDAVAKETRDFVALCKDRAVVKLIIETGCLDASQIALASTLGADAGVDFIKTSTGVSHRGATVDDVRAIKSAVGERVRIKASGGIRRRAEAEALVQAGAARLGCSASVEIVLEV